MPSPTFSVTWSPALIQQIEARQNAPGMRGSRSGTLTAIVLRYAEVTRRAIPKLTEPEWGFLTELLATTRFDAATIDGLGRLVRIPLRTGDRLNRWNVDPDSLGAKLDKLDYAGRLAVVDQIEREASATAQLKRRGKK